MTGTLLLALSLGTAIGAVLGTMGGGGAVLAVPVLVSILGQDVHAATTTSLVVVAGAALVGGLRQAGQGHVCWRAAILLTIAALPGATAGTLANGAVDGRFILVLLGLLILGVAYLTWRRSATRHHPLTASLAGCPTVAMSRLVVAGVALGALTGFFGVGGGFVLVPALALALRFPLRLAIGTSLIIVFLVSLAGLANHLVSGSGVVWSLAVPFAAATIVGSFAGSSLSPRIPQAALARTFALLLVGVALLTFAGA